MRTRDEKRASRYAVTAIVVGICCNAIIWFVLGLLGFIGEEPPMIAMTLTSVGIVMVALVVPRWIRSHRIRRRQDQDDTANG